MDMQDFSFQGEVFLGDRLSGGLPGPLTWVGDSPKATLALANDTEKRTESYTGMRRQSAVLDKGGSATLNMTLNYASSKNLVLATWGTLNQVAAGSVTNETFPTVAVGDVIALEHGGVSSVVLTDSTGSPVTLTLGTHYKLRSANGGTIEILSITGLTQPIKAAYSHTDSSDIAMFGQPSPERYFFLAGVNTIDQSPIRARLYRCKFQPVTGLDLVNDSFGQIELQADVLWDNEAAQDPLLGGFGKIEQPTAVS